MLDNLRIKILYQFKVLEYKIEAWIKILEISKAYSQNKEPADTKRIPHKSWRLVIYVGFLIGKVLCGEFLN